MTNATDKTLSTKLGAFLSMAIFYLAWAAPALAEKVEATRVGLTEHPVNPVIIGIFSVLNVIAGIAIVSTIVFSVWWFLTRKDEEEEEEGADSTEAKKEGEETVPAPSEAGEAKAEEKAEEKSEAKAEEKTEDNKDEAASEGQSKSD
ncbi:MAG: hypothetical protein KGS72_14045 [Cyanobacteria bacterium REEB67]|nr:hypothetical protein [Cyanobacteria bacterium REEB67]